MSRKRQLLRSLTALVCCLALNASAEPPANSPDCQHDPNCQSLYMQAFQQSSDGRPDEALRLYHAAYAVRADPLILFSIARVFHKQGQSSEAISYYQRFIESATRDEAQKAKAREYLAQLAPVAPGPVLAAPPPTTPHTPVHRKGWLWAVLGGGVAAIALGVGLGVGLTQRVPSLPAGVNTYEPAF